jgi:hypothetical protein
VKRSKREKGSKVGGIPSTYASTDPRAMVIMKLDATIALTTVERPWRPQNMTGITIAQLNYIFLFVQLKKIFKILIIKVN